MHIRKKKSLFRTKGYIPGGQLKRLQLVGKQVLSYPWDAYGGNHEEDNAMYFPNSS
jgi:hypothetical protein